MTDIIRAHGVRLAASDDLMAAARHLIEKPSHWALNRLRDAVDGAL